MDIAEAVRHRRSIRAFKPATIPPEILKEIMEIALDAPSWANTQPWEFAIVGGEKIAEIKQAFVEKEQAGELPNPDLTPPSEFPEPYNTRRRTLGIKVFEIKGIKREDKEQRKLWGLQGLKLFEAPCGIYIYIDRSFYRQGDVLNVWPILDCGLVAENIMLLATKYDLGTVAQMQAVYYPQVLRKVLGIPDSKIMVLGIAIGYPNWDDPINQLRSDRDSLDEVANWHGFD